MNHKTIYFSLVVALLVLSACNEKEKRMETSCDMLFTVRGSATEIELMDESVKADIESEMMGKLLAFTNNKSVIEMKLKDRYFDAYQNLKKFKDDKKSRSGVYQFSTDEMKVTFTEGNEERTFFISGPLGNAFYNHFVRRTEATESHIIDAAGVFCLRDDYTQYFQEKYPDAGITTAEIRTDMLNTRRLETTKELAR